MWLLGYAGCTSFRAPEPEVVYYPVCYTRLELLVKTVGGVPHQAVGVAMGSLPRFALRGRPTLSIAPTTATRPITRGGDQLCL
jgi:hypothetical protein